jgi:glycosyltransferase involved in cell wall biosynthesis
MSRVCYQINLQLEFGGGEVFTRSFCRALSALGWRSVLIVARGARFWRSMNIRGTDLVEIDRVEELDAILSPRGSPVIMHNVPTLELARRLASAHLLGGFAHMPLYEREPRGLAACRRVFCVSRHVIDSATEKGLGNVHPEPVYGLADLEPRASAGALVARSPYEWDRRKWRDRALGAFERLVPGAFSSGAPFERATGALTLGIVSRLTPIKQFPQLFSLIAPVLSRYPDVRLEIFGSGGFATLRDLRHALAPCAAQVRFWGHQSDVRAAYRTLDYVLSGLPEKEALGLNLIEAQAGGTPVLAVNAPPFTETVADGMTGYLFPDPRTDGGAGFARLLDQIRDPGLRPDPLRATEHLARFSEPAFRSRVERVMASLEA